MEIKLPILPSKQSFAKIKAPHELDLKAICVFMATGFFLDQDTFWKDEVCLLPGHIHTIDNEGYLIKSTAWFQWHYSPREITFEKALEEYIELLTTITKEQVGDSSVILPLSGGLDSRSQALVFKGLKNKVHSYSYSFQGGYPEHNISKQIAEECGFSFESFSIPKSYLWECIEELSQINKCYSEFTHPRQMAVLKNLRQMKGEFSLGHWGDVFFDRGVPEGTQEKDVMPLLFKKMVKKDGLELAEQLWKTWEIEGDFKSYFISRLEKILSKINIDNLSAKLRVFKTTQWAHRWTSTNLSVFENAHPIHLPFYDDRMCKFICTIPEDYLADRRLQIAHIKQDNALAKITWHENKPFNLLNYKYNKIPYNLPYRILGKLKREFKSIIGKPEIQRNFELQFLGADNDTQLKKYVFENSFLSFVPKHIVNEYYNKFKTKDMVYYSHSLSMLLTLSVWYQQYYLKQS